ncbi:MAG: hypothetical protein ACI9EQ_001972, partial [Bacteroidia bacterium]
QQETSWTENLRRQFPSNCKSVQGAHQIREVTL